MQSHACDIIFIHTNRYITINMHLLVNVPEFEWILEYVKYLLSTLIHTRVAWRVITPSMTHSHVRQHKHTHTHADRYVTLHVYFPVNVLKFWMSLRICHKVVEDSFIRIARLWIWSTHSMTQSHVWYHQYAHAHTDSYLSR